MQFTVRIYKGSKFFIARVPELGVTTQGKSLLEAKRNLRKALHLDLEVIAKYAIYIGQTPLALRFWTKFWARNDSGIPWE
jgi:predicted RNase H-like HicB family nuclease